MALFKQHLDEFGLNREDLFSDEFGLDREDLFGEEGDKEEDPDVDDLESGLQSLEADIDRDLAAYGAWYGAEAEAMAQPGNLAALHSAVDIGVLLPEKLQGGYIEGFYEWYHDRAVGDEGLEIARRLAEGLSQFDWSKLSPVDKRELVKVAVIQSAIPGIDLSADDVIRNAIEPEVGVVDSLWAAAKATPAMAFRYFTSDLPKTFGSLIVEVPVLGPLYEDYWKALGITKRKNADQAINSLAMTYLALSWMGFPVYDWIADKIDAEGAMLSFAPAGPTLVEESLSIETGVAPAPPLPEPTEYAERRGGMPTPEVILAFGYGLTALGAITGILG